MKRDESFLHSHVLKLVDRGQIMPRVLWLTEKVLRFLQAGINNPPRLFRINRNLPFGSFLAVKGEVLIHGPNLVAWPVGSERRNHHLQQVIIQTNP